MKQDQPINTDNLKKLEPITTPPIVDENMGVFVYGGIVIRDIESGKILVKKSF